MARTKKKAALAPRQISRVTIYNRGFTLIELIIVMAIMAMFVLFAVPKSRDNLDMNLKKQARMLSGSIRYLYDQSVIKNKIFRLHYDLENHTYWIEKSEDVSFKLENAQNRPLETRETPKTKPAFSEDKDLLKKHVQLDKHIKFKDIKTPKSQEPQTSGDAYTHFFPSGRAEPTQIRLEADNGHIYTIVLNPLTGAAKVYAHDIEK